MMFDLTQSSYDNDIICPKCKTNYHINWNTEYGDPLIGDHSIECPKCRKVISFEVYYQYIQTEEI